MRIALLVVMAASAVPAFAADEPKLEFTRLSYIDGKETKNNAFENNGAGLPVCGPENSVTFSGTVTAVGKVSIEIEVAEVSVFDPKKVIGKATTFKPEVKDGKWSFTITPPKKGEEAVIASGKAYHLKTTFVADGKEVPVPIHLFNVGN
jgi:hypothetical protein